MKMKEKLSPQMNYEQTYGYQIPHLEAPKQEQSPRISALLSLQHHLQFHSLLQPKIKELDQQIYNMNDKRAEERTMKELGITS